MNFDPYHQWLGIPPHEQPANLYRLLGLPQGEADKTRIAAAADQRMAHVRTFQLGPQAGLSQRLLNELATARVILLDPRRKAAYDAVLTSATPAVTSDVQALPGARQAPAAPSAAELAPGAVVGPYRVVERVSASSLGRIYKVEHAQTGRFSFLKMLPAEAARSQEVKKRFQREIDILLKLDHPNLIVGREAGVHQGQDFLVMDYVLGTDLATLVKQQGPLAVDDAVNYAVQAARGLGQLHDNGVFHRNVKPQVLLVDVQGNIRITNLLLAKLGEGSTIEGAEENLTVAGEAMGSVDYLPPEQAIDPRQADGRSDLYALGCTLCFLLTGQPPYTMKNAMQKIVAHRSGPIPSLRSARPDVPEHVDRAFQKLLAKDPSQRPPHAAAAIAELEGTTAASAIVRTRGASSGGKGFWQKLMKLFGG